MQHYKDNCPGPHGPFSVPLGSSQAGVSPAWPPATGTFHWAKEQSRQLGALGTFLVPLPRDGLRLMGAWCLQHFCPWVC